MQVRAGGGDQGGAGGIEHPAGQPAGLAGARAAEHGERAADLLAAASRRTGGVGGDREFWDAQARRVLAALLHAAALDARSISDVLGWVADAERAARDVPALLRRSGVPAFEQDALQFIGTNERTRTSITSTVMPALGWLTHPAAAAAAAPDPRGFDVAELLAQRATVFLLGVDPSNGPSGRITMRWRSLCTTWQPFGIDSAICEMPRTCHDVHSPSRNTCLGTITQISRRRSATLR
jgi:hypothetical protein